MSIQKLMLFGASVLLLLCYLALFLFGPTGWKPALKWGGCLFLLSAATLLNLQLISDGI